jgi:hypothetical protein
VGVWDRLETPAGYFLEEGINSIWKAGEYRCSLRMEVAMISDALVLVHRNTRRYIAKGISNLTTTKVRVLNILTMQITTFYSPKCCRS